MLSGFASASQQNPLKFDAQKEFVDSGPRFSPRPQPLVETYSITNTPILRPPSTKLRNLALSSESQKSGNDLAVALDIVGVA
jgi:hypothetical protein